MTSKLDTLILTDQDLRALIRLDDLVNLQREAFVSTTSQRFSPVPRTGLVMGPEGATVATMMAPSPDGTIVACKVLASAKANRQRGLPRSMSTIVVIDARTGFPLAILAGSYLTNARTAATAVLALESLGTAGQHEIGLFGAGPIAQLILEVLSARGEEWDVVLYAPTAAHRERVEKNFEGHERLRVRSVTDPVVAASRPSVLLATAGSATALEAGWLHPHGLVISIASRKNVAEVPRDALRAARLVVDDRETARSETAEFVDVPPEHMETLGEVLATPRDSPAKPRRCIFKSSGLAIQDTVVAAAVVRSAGTAGLGRRWSLLHTGEHGP